MKRYQPEDIWQFIDTKNGDAKQCWPWLGSFGGRDNDRPRFSIGGRQFIAYRFLYELMTGEALAKDDVIRHTCDNPHCMNPEHHVKGTQSENEKDKLSRDRVGLPVAIVREIRIMLERTPMTQKEIAAYCTVKFDRVVSREAVRNIKLGLRRTDGNELTREEVIAAENLTTDA